ncbi:dickkopf-related protein 3a [Antennarius striatus]|uniref:dickkopf-related protein 3a n=1 Tax=Antennarius striatus TaxID=241820 RepID=UPI0035B35F0B
MTQLALLVLLLTAGCNGILPEIVDSGISYILEDDYTRGRTELEEERPSEEPQETPEDAFKQGNVSLSSHPSDLPPSHHNETGSDAVRDSEPVFTSAEQETNNITAAIQSTEMWNNIDRGCMTEEDCGVGSYCFYDLHNSKCLPCKATDVSCTKDEQCCSDQLCVWGQCSPNATKGGAGSTCQYQTDCSTDLCCAFHKALLFPVCLAKPIERERCFGASNHLTELLPWDIQDDGPRKHCPCAGALQCQQLGRGSMCLKGEDQSEEDLTDTLYSEIDYIL